ALYGALEAVVGICALLLGAFISETQAVSAALVQTAGDDAFLLFAVRVAVAALWILPPTVAMGATYPAVLAALEGLGHGRRAASRPRPPACRLPRRAPRRPRRPARRKI